MPTTLRSLLEGGSVSNVPSGDAAANGDNDVAMTEENGVMDTTTMAHLDPEQQMLIGSETRVFSPEERAKLILAVGGQTGDLIDWLSISADVFGNKFSPKECIFEFLKLPISQSLALNTESQGEQQSTSVDHLPKSLNQSNAFAGEFAGKTTMSVFNDHGNPLLSQVAIFARLLEQLKADTGKNGGTTGSGPGDHIKNLEKGDENNNVGAAVASESAEQVQPMETTKRTTRGAQKRKEQESTQVIKSLTENAQALENHYLVPPSSSKMLDGVISAEQLTKIETNLKGRASMLSREKHHEMEELLNEIVYQQMKKLKTQAAFLKEFDQVYEL